jgi:lysophospholipase L1-like esterase
MHPVGRTRGGVTALEASRLYQPTVAKTRVACVGDSITFGYHGLIPDDPYGLVQSSSNYPAFLQQLLGPNYEVSNFGEVKNYVQRVPPLSYWSSESFGRLTNTTWDVIVIMLGTNDARLDVWKPGCEHEFSSCRFVVDYNSMIRTVRNLGRVPGQSPMILLMVPPPVFFSQTKNDSAALNPTVVNTVISQLVPQIAEANNLPVINLFQAFGSQKFNFMCDDSWCDAVHPSDEGFRAIGFAVAGRISTAR